MVTEQEISEYIVSANLTYLGPIHWLDIQEKWVKQKFTGTFTVTIQFLSGCQVKCAVTQWKKHLKKLNDENCYKAIGKTFQENLISCTSASQLR